LIKKKNSYKKFLKKREILKLSLRGDLEVKLLKNVIFLKIFLKISLFEKNTSIKFFVNESEKKFIEYFVNESKKKFIEYKNKKKRLLKFLKKLKSESTIS
jgi:hypothetical protein